MTPDTDPLSAHLKAWSVAAPDAQMAGRLTAHAVAQPQALRWADSLTRTFSEWRYGLAYKAAAMALCALLGLGVGLMGSSAADTVAFDALDIALMRGI